MVADVGNVVFVGDETLGRKSRNEHRHLDIHLVLGDASRIIKMHSANTSFCPDGYAILQWNLDVHCR